MNHVTQSRRVPALSIVAVLVLGGLLSCVVSRSSASMMDARGIRLLAPLGAPRAVGGSASDDPNTARTHRLISPDARSTARVIKSLIDALGGEADVREVQSGGGRRLRLELSVPQESSAYLLSRLEALGQITPALPDPQMEAERYAVSVELVGTP